MTTPRDPDTILSSWLEEGPTELPDATRRAIAVTTRTTEQKGRPLWAPWRASLMTSFARVAVAAIAAVAAVAVVGGAVYFIGTDQDVGGVPPASSPSVTSAPASRGAQATVPIEWATYTSSRFAYSIDYPADWVVTPATANWAADHHLPFPDGPAVDRFGASPDSDTYVFATSDPLGPDQVAAERIAQLDFVNAGEGGSPVACVTSDRHTITVDGVDARQEDQLCFQTDHLIEVVVVHDGRFHMIDLVSKSPISEANRATFDRFLASFKFGG